jgi:hypothetical protein
MGFVDSEILVVVVVDFAVAVTAGFVAEIASVDDVAVAAAAVVSDVAVEIAVAEGLAD